MTNFTGSIYFLFCYEGASRKFSQLATHTKEKCQSWRKMSHSGMLQLLYWILLLLLFTYS